jgi:glycerol-3-phosphate acyltransferase PlsY
MNVPPGIFWAVLLAGAYLIGSLPFGLIAGWILAGVDIRKIGSGNIGATNAARALGGGSRAAGFLVFLLVFVLDGLKGAGPVLLAGALSPERSARAAAIGAGCAAILGHMFSVFLRLRGGKGVAVGTGVMLALVPLPTMLAAGVFGILLAVFRYVSLGSVAAAVSLPTFLVALEGKASFRADLPLFLFTCAVAVFVVIKHRANIVRLASGTENRIGGRRPVHED